MTPKQFKGRMKKLFPKKHDPSVSHAKADDLMCELLKQLGYTEGVEIFEQAQKWYH